MSTKSTKSTHSQLRNSFAALQGLDDHLDATPAKKKNGEKKVEQVVSEVKKQAVPKAPSTESQKKKEKKERQKAAAAATTSNSSSGQKKVQTATTKSEPSKKEATHSPKNPTRYPSYYGSLHDYIVVLSLK